MAGAVSSARSAGGISLLLEPVVSSLTSTRSKPITGFLLLHLTLLHSLS